MTFRILLTLALATGLWLPTMATASPAVVIVVRHAEKETFPATDPPLSPAGKRRAEELARAVAAITAAGGKVRGLFASDTKRAQETLAPLAAATRATVTVVEAKDYSALARKILALRGGIAVVAGHSNTVPGIIQALGGPAGVAVEDAEYSQFFVLTVSGRSLANLVVLRYGE